MFGRHVQVTRTFVVLGTLDDVGVSRHENDSRRKRLCATISHR